MLATKSVLPCRPCGCSAKLVSHGASGKSMDGIIDLVEGGDGELVGTKRSLLGIIDLVEPQRYRQRSSLLCQHARVCRKLIRQQREDSNEFVRRQVETHNKRMAVRWADVMQLRPEPGTRRKGGQRRKTQIEGEGRYKM